MTIIDTPEQALECLYSSWQTIIRECRLVYGGELHYQAMIYYALRTDGAVPLTQIGMNVKQYIENPVSELFKSLDMRKHIDFRGGFETIPDIVIFRAEIGGDWRRRNRSNTLRHMLLAIEIKASERHLGRLRPGEIKSDLKKLSAHRSELRRFGNNTIPVMIIIDTADLENERMTLNAIDECKHMARVENIPLLYCSQIDEFATRIVS